MQANAWFSHERYPVVLFALLVAFAALLAIAPHDRAAWGLENALLFVAVAALVAVRCTLPLSRVSYTLIFVFCCLHSIGAHYTYSEVPYQDWLAALTGWRPAGRNQYDRIVHFAYGLLSARCSYALPTCAVSGATTCRST
jgi:putative membrane protein